jgi:hypothetical protein
MTYVVSKFHVEMDVIHNISYIYKTFPAARGAAKDSIEKKGVETTEPHEKGAAVRRQP